MKKKLIIPIAVVVLAIVVIVGIAISSGNKNSETAANPTEASGATEASNATGASTATEASGDLSGSEESAANATEEASGTGTADSAQDSGEQTGTVLGDEFVVSVNAEDSWGESPVFTRLSIVLENESDVSINGWKLNINVGEDAAIDNGWSGNYSIEDGILTVTGVEYNSLLTTGSSCEIGVILSGVTGDLQLEQWSE